MIDEQTGEVYETDGEWIGIWEAWAQTRKIMRNKLVELRNGNSPLEVMRDKVIASAFEAYRR